MNKEARDKNGRFQKEERLEVTPFEESYPYNVLYDIIKMSEYETEDKESLINYDISEFIKYMNARLMDRELRCIECKYRYNMTLEETAKQFNVTRERIRQILARAERKLRARIFTCHKITEDSYIRLLSEHRTMYETLDKIMVILERASGKSTEDILEALNNLSIRPIVPEGASTDDAVDYLELSVRSYNCLKRAGFKSVKDIIDMDEKSENSEWVFKIRNLGRKSAEEIKDRLAEKYNYTLKAWRAE